MIKLLGKIPNNIFVAVSGGADSMAALSFVDTGRRNVRVLHFDHGSEHAKDAREFVQDFCTDRDIPVHVGALTRTKNDGESWEEYWRNERYSFLKQYSSSAPIITAHHLDDVAEWWIFTSLRGDGKLMPYQNKEYNIIRPFLASPRTSLVSWCDRHGVPYLHDPSNDSRAHMRNVIRHDIMPSALVVNPGLAKTMKKKLHGVYSSQQDPILIMDR